MPEAHGRQTGCTWPWQADPGYDARQPAHGRLGKLSGQEVILILTILTTSRAQDMYNTMTPNWMAHTREASSSWFASKPSETVFNLRKYYPDDKVLMDFANFVEAAVADDPATTFKSEYRRVMIPRSTDGSFKVF